MRKLHSLGGDPKMIQRFIPPNLHQQHVEGGDRFLPDSWHSWSTMSDFTSCFSFSGLGAPAFRVDQCCHCNTVGGEDLHVKVLGDVPQKRSPLNEAKRGSTKKAFGGFGKFDAWPKSATWRNGIWLQGWRYQKGIWRVWRVWCLAKKCHVAGSKWYLGPKTGQKCTWQFRKGICLQGWGYQKGIWCLPKKCHMAVSTP